MPDGGSALSLLCVFLFCVLLLVSVSCSSVSSSSFFLFEDGSRWSCYGGDGEEQKWWSRGTVVVPTSAAGGGRWQMLCSSSFFSVVFPFSPLSLKRITSPPSVLTFLSFSFSFSFFLLPALSLPCLFLSVSSLFLSKKKTDGLSLSVSLTFSFKKILPALLFFALFSSVFLKLTPLESIVCFSPSPKFPPSFTVVPPLLFISKRRRGSPYPCRGVV